MTPDQNLALARIARAALEKAGGNADLKRWEVTPAAPNSPALIVHVEAGTVGDEDTIKEVLFRFRGHFLVGVRGGIDVIGRRFFRRDKSNAKKYPLIYGFRYFEDGR